MKSHSDVTLRITANSSGRVTGLIEAHDGPFRVETIDRREIEDGLDVIELFDRFTSHLPDPPDPGGGLPVPANDEVAA